MAAYDLQRPVTPVFVQDAMFNYYQLLRTPQPSGEQKQTTISDISGMNIRTRPRAGLSVEASTEALQAMNISDGSK